MGCQKKINYYQQKVITFGCLKSILQAMMVIQIFLVFAPLENSHVLHNNKKATNWISTRVSPKKFTAFDVNLTLAMTNLVHGRVSLKFNIIVLVQK